MTTSSEAYLPNLVDIRHAKERIRGVVQNTPLDYSATFSALTQNDIYLKLENLQKTGSFKLRGAYNKLSSLDEAERARGVIAASAGNHAQGVAYAATRLGIECTIVMPENASLAKVAATQRYGATVVLFGESYDDAYQHALDLQQQSGRTYIHAFDDPLIIAGQGTIGLEIYEALPTVNAVLVPMGGGGLATGIGIALKEIAPHVRLIGIEAANVACFRHSLDIGELATVPGQPTIADGIAVKRPGQLTYALAKRYVDDVVTVEEEEISRTMVMLMERSKLVTEGAAAAAMAAAVYHKVPENLGNVVVVLSGGNVDVTTLSKIIEHGLTEAGRYLRIAVTIPDKPGALRDVLDAVAEVHANVLTVEHHRMGAHILFGQTKIELDLETRDRRHIEQLIHVLQSKGYDPKLVD
ncbi:MAG: threonine ammonia-lyase [Alicyclobacillaceae bacterium]|jgi:threonine dehydratase|uniref:threonine ammonia-lyase n=1 Tax=Alicyclobacillus sp. SP_1 TaxID=2942475 RepID=UPI002157C818|nr:threonine ammonia-lyase [Alicyclobacillus sp. SP_1]MCY0888848.1 threonine ammonia-lyase [Alicyclobacillaceae bacterium]